MTPGLPLALSEAGRREVVQMTWACFISTVKDGAVLIGLGVALCALWNHRKSIFKPHEKKLEDRQFDLLEKLSMALRRSDFVFLYETDQHLISISAGILKSIIKPVGECASSPFSQRTSLMDAQKF